MEEPPTKVLKMEVAPTSLDSTMEGQEEGQEEWLSEGVLTDDDYMAANTSQDSTAPDANGTAESAQSLDLPQALEMPQQDEQESHLQELAAEASVTMEQNIEDTLNNFEGMETETKEDAFEELLKAGKESPREKSEHNSDDDGHNTDDLLRMLGEDDNKMKKKVLSMREKKVRRDEPSSDDDFNVFEGAKVTKLKLAKNAMIRKQAIKAEPEDMSDRDSDMSDDDVSTVKRMFTANQRPAGRAPKSRQFTSSVKTEKPKPTPVKQYSNTSKSKSLLKPQDKAKGHQDTINDEEFLEDDDFDLDDENGDDSSVNSATRTQPIRRPERMDEEVPSDEESQSEDDSLYDVMPSSDSEEMDDWFTLDIRAERAGDYLPWLGDKAHKLLAEEKQRVTARLTALRQSVTALQSSARVQSDQIKVATEALHELDAMLAAA